MKTRILQLIGLVFLLAGLSLMILALFTVPRPIQAGPRILYAKPDGVTSGNCDSWSNACTLAYALSLAVSGDEIWVQKGIHYPGTARTDSFILKNGVAVYGGFAGTEASRDGRDWQTNLTVLSGDIDRNDITDPNGVVTSTNNIKGANSYHVLHGANLTRTAILDGFVVTAGKADGGAPNEKGGGMLNLDSNPTLVNIIFIGNYAYYNGGGIYGYRSSPALISVTLTNDYAGYRGGGMYNDPGNPALVNVTFSNNNSGDWGGGMYNSGNPTLTNVVFSNNSGSVGGGMYNSGNPIVTNVIFSNNSGSVGGGMYNSGNPIVTNVIFTNNSAYFYGGGMYNSSDATLTNVTFGNNSASWGGGMYNYFGNPTLTKVTFSNNSASNNSGGGMYNEYGDPTLANVTFSNNSAPDGGGMYNDYGDPTLINVTFSDNSAGRNGGGIHNSGGSLKLINAVFEGNNAPNNGGGIYTAECWPRHSKLINTTFYSNTATWGGGIYNAGCYLTLTNVIIWNSYPSITNMNATPSISYSDIERCGSSGAGWNSACGQDGGGNKEADPRFVDAANGDLHLQTDSPCVDAGDANAILPIVVDRDGNPRFMDVLSVPNTGRGIFPVDMGAYEAPGVVIQPRWVYLPLVLRNKR